jgi:Leucine-rich repeat (LRR) protein
MAIDEINIESESIPYEVLENNHLQKLSISLDEFDLGNREVLKPNYLVGLNQLTELDLTGINISTDILKNEICKLTHLQELTLMYSSISLIPDEIENLTSLKKLVLRCNYISSLPDSFMNLDKLEELNLIDNKFIDIPLCLFKMKKLKRLCLRDNPLDSKYNDIINSLGNVIMKK